MSDKDFEVEMYRLFIALDQDGDGFLTFTEYKKMPLKVLQAKFEGQELEFLL
jgi:hypothetical protein